MFLKQKFIPFYLVFSHGYEPMSSLCYVMAIIAVLYCQDSLYRLNAIISSMFIIIALQQLFMPKLLVKNEPKEENIIDTVGYCLTLIQN